MAVKVHALVSISGKVDVSYAQSNTLASSSSLIPDALAAAIKTKIQTIGGVQNADVHCGILDLEEVTTE